MNRRHFLMTTFLLGPASAVAEDGDLLGLVETSPTDGDLLGAVGTTFRQDINDGNLLGDIPDDVVQSVTKRLVVIYSPETWRCPHCDEAEKAIKKLPGIEVVVKKTDTLPSWADGASYPVIHFAPGKKDKGWIVGWPGLGKFVEKVFDDKSQPPEKNPKLVTKSDTVDIKDRGGSHWSVEGDWSPSREKTINHLVSVHGYSRERVESLNIGQLLTLHDYAHEGTLTKSRHPVKGMTEWCPTGNCPTQTRSYSPRRKSFFGFTWE